MTRDDLASLFLVSAIFAVATLHMMLLLGAR